MKRILVLSSLLITGNLFCNGDECENLIIDKAALNVTNGFKNIFKVPFATATGYAGYNISKTMIKNKDFSRESFARALIKLKFPSKLMRASFIPGALQLFLGAGQGMSYVLFGANNAKGESKIGKFLWKYMPRF